MTKEEATIQALQGHIEALNETIEKQDKVIKALEQQDALDKIRAEIEQQEKRLRQAGINPYNVAIALDTIKSAVKESEVGE